jgi:hypothetical protein
MVFEAEILQAAFARILRLKDGGFQSKYGCFLTVIPFD